jgi:hypothetical protein
MSNSPTSFRLPFVMSPDVHPDVQQAVRYAFSGIKDLNDAVAQLAKNTSSTTTVVTSTSAAPGGSSSGPVAGSIGVVDQQSTGVYTLLAGDFGAIVVLDTAPTFALTLAAFSTPFYSIISNQCVGVATLTAESGTVNGLASWPIPPGGFAVVAFDGMNWWAAPVCPQNTPPIPSNFITGYDSATGEFFQSEIVIDSGGSITLDSGASLVCQPGSSVSLRNLRIFSNNGSAVAGGLVAGNIYRLGGDPDLLAVVH